jgi:hypothetical protein
MSYHLIEDSDKHSVYRCGSCKGLAVTPKNWPAPAKCSKCAAPPPAKPARVTRRRK